MRKRIFGRKLSRGRKSREALFYSLIRAFLIYGKMTTTKAKAKAIQPQIDKLITKARKNTLSARRSVASFLKNDRNLVEILFKRVIPSIGNRKSGFTRVTKLVSRKSDQAEMVRLEWVDKIVISEEVTSNKTKKESETKESVSKKIIKKPKLVGKSQ